MASALFLRLPLGGQDPSPVMTLPECLHEWPPLDLSTWKEFQQEGSTVPSHSGGRVPVSHLKSVCI